MYEHICMYVKGDLCVYGQRPCDVGLCCQKERKKERKRDMCLDPRSQKNKEKCRSSLSF